MRQLAELSSGKRKAPHGESVSSLDSSAVIYEAIKASAAKREQQTVNADNSSSDEESDSSIEDLMDWRRKKWIAFSHLSTAVVSHHWLCVWNHFVKQQPADGLFTRKVCSSSCSDLGFGFSNSSTNNITSAAPFTWWYQNRQQTAIVVNIIQANKTLVAKVPSHGANSCVTCVTILVLTWNGTIFITK